ncbi:MAG TPA: MlaD family protein [Burkholderiales bacterium]|nr:MlaD family protein [Burkholderiales bacterium]
MDPEAKYGVVGVAVIVLMGAIVAAVLWLRSTGEGGDDRYYKVYFERQSLEGLEIRSDVRMRGIRVGSVTEFLFSSRRPGAVEVFIRVEGSTPVRESTQAVVERHLVTGIASIRLLNSTEDSPRLTAVPAGEPYPVIAEGESRIEQFSESLNHLAQRAEETMLRINATLSPENRAALAETLDSLRQASRGAEKSVASVGAAAEEVRKLAASIGADAHKLAQRYDSLGAQAGESLKDVGASVRALREDVARLTERADRLMASGEGELRSTARALREAAESLGEAAEGLRDPGQAIFGPPEGALGPGEGKK